MKIMTAGTPSPMLGENDHLHRLSSPDGPPRRRHGYAESEVTHRLIIGIFEQRLPPGVRVTEVQLAEAFQVSRTVARQSMNKLSEIGVFRKTPNLGYTIASPSRTEARMMLELRGMIEPQMVSKIAATRTAEDLALLEEHIALEQQARNAGQRATLVRLTGEFHLRLAEVSGNPYLIRFITQLQVLTCLAILVHAESETGCPKGDHAAIVRAIAGGDSARAAAGMAHHLNHISEELQLDNVEPEPNLESALSWLTNAHIG